MSHCNDMIIARKEYGLPGNSVWNVTIKIISIPTVYISNRENLTTGKKGDFVETPYFLHTGLFLLLSDSMQSANGSNSICLRVVDHDGCSDNAGYVDR
jgi:hypothetical protein